MKRILSLFLCLMLCLTLIPAAAAEGEVEINETNFPDEAFRNYVSAFFDTDGDGLLGEEEIAAATRMEMDFNTAFNCYSLQGVEFLTELTSISAQNLSASELDLSANTKLEELDFTTAALSELDLHANTALRRLVCPGTRLSELDISALANLQELDVGSTRLRNLDLSNNTALLNLYCSNAKLGALDLSCNTELRRLSCGNNSFSQLDLSCNTKLTELSCAMSKVTSLDLSMLPELEYLGLTASHISDLDLSGNPKLKCLYVAGSYVQALDVSMCPILAETVRARNYNPTPYQDHWKFENGDSCIYFNEGVAIYADPRPVITAQPQSQTVTEGETAVFSVSAEGEYGLSYQWYYRKSESGDWNMSSGESAVTDTLPVAAKAYRSGYQYRCVVTNGHSAPVETEPVTLTVRVKPVITAQPQNQTVTEGETAQFSVGATGATGYQWYYRTSGTGAWSKCSNGGAATLSVEAKTYRNGYQYRCEVSNDYGTVSSEAVTLTVTPGSKPVITEQPKSVISFPLLTAKFTVTATGAETYQWQYRKSSSGAWNNSTASGAQTKTLSIVTEDYRNGYQYRCKVSNRFGTTYSEPATLTVSTDGKPVITEQPQSIRVPETWVPHFSVEAWKADSYQWQYRTSGSGAWNNCTDGTAKTKTLVVGALLYRNGYQYRCKVTNNRGTTISEIATLTVIAKPRITTQPQSVTAAAGETVQFTVTATGDELSYQWYYRTSGSGEWNKCSNGYSATLSVEAKSYRNGYQYRCQIKNEAGSVTSSAATLTVAAKPTITTQPKDQTAAVGETVKFTVKAGGADSYQWYFRKSSSDSWSKCSGASATTATLSVEAKAYRNGYQYRCLVKNAAGQVYSSAATLTVK